MEDEVWRLLDQALIHTGTAPTVVGIPLEINQIKAAYRLFGSGASVLSEAHERIKLWCVNETGWFPLVKSSPICPNPSRRSAKHPDRGFMARLMALCSLPRT